MKEMYELSCNQSFVDLVMNVRLKNCTKQIHQQILNLSMNSAPDIVREFRMTEISIEINEDGTIESREIHIEHTEEYRFPNEEA